MYKYLKSKQTIIYIFIAVLAAIMGTGFSMVISHLIDLVSQQSEKKLLLFLLFSCTYVILTVALEMKYTFLKYQIVRQSSINLKNDIFKKIFKRSCLDFEKEASSYYLTELTTKSEMCSELYFKNLLTVPYLVFSFASAVIACLYINSLMLIVMVIFGTLTVLITHRVGGSINESAQKLSDESPKYTGIVKDFLEGFRTIKIFGAEEYAKRNQEAFNVRLEDAKYSNIKNMVLVGSIGEVIGLLSTVLVTGIASIIALRGWISLGSVFALTQLMGKITSPITSAVDMLTQMKSIRPINAEFVGLLKEKETPERNVNPENYDLSVKELTFKYSEMEGSLLERLSFDVKQGEKILILGDNGSGKSSLMSLILGFIIPQEGEITWDGYNISELNKKNFYSKIGYLSQQPFIFQDTLKNNIRLGRQISDDKINTIIKEVGLEKLVKDLPHGLNSYLDEAGKNISGGEKQRVCLARILVNDVTTIVLDEFETGIDASSQENIEDIILKKGATVIAISHNISSEHQSKYDKIYSLKDGILQLK